LCNNIRTMKFSFRKKKNPPTQLPSYVRMRPRVDNSAILVQAKKRNRQQIISSGKQIKAFEFLNNVGLKRILVIIGIVSLVVLGFLFLKNSNAFDVKEVELIVDTKQDYEQIKQIVNEYMGRNIIFVSASQIEASIKNKFNSIHTVYIDRSLNGKLKVEVIEDVPVYYQANNVGIYLINQRGEVMEIVESKGNLVLDSTEKLIQSNALPLDSDQVRIKYLDGFPEEERAKIIWKDVSAEDRQSTLNKMREELNAKINDFSNKLTEQLSSDEFRDLTGSYIPNNYKYAVGDKIDLENLRFVSLVNDFLKSKKFVPIKSVWISDYSLQIFLEGNPTIVVSTKRGSAEQFTDLSTLIYHEQFNAAKLIDVRSSNYSVIR
jgi:hypothetical protein